MSARDTILRAVRAAQPSARQRAVGSLEFRSATEDAAERLKEVLTAGGTTVIDGRRSEIANIVRPLSTRSKATWSEIPEVTSTVPRGAGTGQLAELELFVAQGELGVAENGAVWLPQSRIGNRAALFLAEHVVLALDRAAVVSDLHAAYTRLDVGAEPFGTFVAGPSKTADIEQALVIGAHGPKRLTLILLDTRR